MNFSTNDSLECETGQDIPITSPFFNRNLTRFRSVPAPNKRPPEQETRTFRQGAEAIRREIRCKRIAGLEKQVWDDGSQAFIGKLVLRVADINLINFIVFMVIFPCLQFVICYIGAYVLQYVLGCDRLNK